MFILTFSADDKIHDITKILGSKVEIHPNRKSKLIPQCKYCQSYGHTQKYCRREPRCVKCTSKHHSKDCKKPTNIKPKCVHCGDEHPANYRGCSVAMELQKIKNKNMKSKMSNQPQPQMLKDTGQSRPIRKTEQQTDILSQNIIGRNQWPELPKN